MVKNYKLNMFILIIIMCANLFLTGCGKNYENNDKIKLAYYGQSVELPLITAFKEGYFKEEGLDVELVKLNYEDFINNINNKIIDGGTCDYRVIKNIEDGANVKIGVGLHSGAIAVLVNKESKIETINDLKNKKIGIQDKGSGTMLAAKTLFDKYDVDLIKDIQLSYSNGDKIVESLRTGTVDGIVLWQSDKYNNDEFKTIFKADDVNAVSAFQHSHHGNEYLYISFAGLSKDIVDKTPQKAAGILRAWIRGCNEVNENKEEYLKRAIDNGYIDGDYEKNYASIKQFMWMPGVKQAKDNLLSYIKIQKSIGILSSDLKEEEFCKRSFADVLPFWD